MGGAHCALTRDRSCLEIGAEIADGLCYPGKEMSMSGSDITVEILKDIREDIRGVREEIHGVRTELREEIHGVRTELREQIQSVRTELGAELRIHTESFGVVETALRELAEQQRFVVRYTKALAERDSRLEGRVTSLESRVDKLESK